MTRFRVGVQLHPQVATVDELRAAWRAADALGVDSIWVWDHFFPLYGNPDANHYEAYTLLAAMAADTSHARLGALVTCNSYRNPQLLADMARTVDHISSGRLILGIGAGWFQRDYDEYGYEFGTPATRLKALGKSLPLILSRFGKLNPPPTRKIPILIGGGGEKVTLRLTAQYADIWNSFGPVANWQHKNQVLDDWCAKVGRDPKAIERSVAGINNEDIAHNLNAFVDAGATHFIYGMGDPWDFAPVEKLVAWREKNA
jgi:probable F420-dependent oxidoreductase